jgi:FtsZ-binding cell division protein ZapB
MTGNILVNRNEVSNTKRNRDIIRETNKELKIKQGGWVS